MHDRRHLLIDAAFDESDRLRCNCFRERRMATSQIVKPRRNKLIDSLFKSSICDVTLESFLNKIERFIDRLIVHQVAEISVQQFVDLLVDEAFDQLRGFFAAQHVGDVLGQPELKGGEHRRHVARSEEHTSELQSPCNLVCRLLLEKKKNYITHTTRH